MRTYARIFHYLRHQSGAIIGYLVCILLSILFSIVSFGMLAPFFDLIFNGDNSRLAQPADNAAMETLRQFLLNRVDQLTPVNTLGIICFIILFNNVLDDVGPVGLLLFDLFDDRLDDLFLDNFNGSFLLLDDNNGSGFFLNGGRCGRSLLLLCLMLLALGIELELEITDGNLEGNGETGIKLEMMVVKTVVVLEHDSVCSNGGKGSDQNFVHSV